MNLIQKIKRMLTSASDIIDRSDLIYRYDRNVVCVLDDDQRRRLDRWCQKHLAECHDEEFHGDSFGTWLEYRIVPSGIGDSITVKCLYDDAWVSLTLGDDGEFLYDEDGTPSWEKK